MTSGRGSHRAAKTLKGSSDRRGGSVGNVRAQSYPENSQGLLSRRGFVVGALGVAAACATGGVLAATQCSKNGSATEGGKSGTASAGSAGTGSTKAISVSADSVFTTENCEYIENLDDAVKLAGQVKLPYGSMLWAGDDQVAACLLPCETSTPLTQVGILTFDNATVNTVLDGAVGTAEGFEIYDVRANSQGAVWTEADILGGRWRVYTAPLAGAHAEPVLGTPVMGAEGNADWEMPELAVSGDFAFWQLVPNLDGPLKKENSLLMRARFGDSADEAKVVCESRGRFACRPSASASGIAVAPRVSTSGTAYELTHIDASSGETTDRMLLPTSMKPTYVAHGTTGFSFAFEDIYNYGDGISQLGTYTPAQTGAPGTTDASGEWFHFARTPFTEPAWCGDWFVVKSTSVVAGIDLKNRRYFSMSPENATQGYGEFLASSGASDRFVTYSNIDYTPLNGNRITECNVRIWQSA